MRQLNDRIVVLKTAPNVLVLRHSVLRASLSLLGYLAFLAFWYWLLFYVWDLGGRLRWSWMAWLFAAVPLLNVPAAARLLRTCLKGRVYEFDGMARAVRRNGDDVARFGEVRKVQLRTIRDPEASDEYRLSLVLDDGSKIPLAHTPDGERVAQAADDIADLIGVEVVRK